MDFKYTDGGESKLSEIFKGENFSENDTWRKYLSNWALFYHLSPVRKNLLKWIDFGKKDITVLELGAGCGAITSSLAKRTEITRHVAVEGAESRANLVRERCKNYKHVEVVNCNFEDYKTDEKFDFVFIIGVMEYSGRYIDAENPYQKFIDHAASYLSDDGVLVMAIENQMGHKYLAGFNEDHYGKPYLGLSDYQEYKGIRTFDKPTIEKMLADAELKNTHFYYPFPDYKLPKYIINEKAFDDKDLTTLDIVEFPTVDPSHKGHVSNFNEKRFLNIVSKSIDPGYFMNSFLVFAGKNKLENHADFLVAKFNNERFLDKQTSKFFKRIDGELMVETKGHNSSIEKYHVDHESLFDKMLVAHLGKNTSQFEIEFEQWKKLLESKVVDSPDQESFKVFTKKALKREVYKNESQYISAKLIDLIPSNILVSKADGSLKIIDQEWELPCEVVPLKYVVDRGLLYFLSFVQRHEKIEKTIDGQWNLPLEVKMDSKTICDLDLLETWFQQMVYSNSKELSQEQSDSIFEQYKPKVPSAVVQEVTFKHKAAYKLAKIAGKFSVVRKFSKYVND